MVVSWFLFLLEARDGVMGRVYSHAGNACAERREGDEDVCVGKHILVDP